MAKPVKNPLSEKECFALANDPDFSWALMDAEDGARRPTQGGGHTFKTIGHRMTLIQELEKQGFKIIKEED